jgi:hypothetical protein
VRLLIAANVGPVRLIDNSAAALDLVDEPQPSAQSHDPSLERIG